METVIGKDVIESLTLGMYEDSKFIYREYIQNAADQIDKAVEIGLLPSRGKGRIEIQIRKNDKSIIISDNATGIQSSKVDNLLRNIAQSTKERGINKGFRGIGRLGGLGYCNKLEFITSSLGENIKTTMVWDAKKLKKIINDRSTKESASKVIDQVTSIQTEEEKPDKHYFIVKLYKVKNDELLAIEEIKEYLRLVAPVQYHPRFMFYEELYKDLDDNSLKIDEYPIWVNTDQIFKRYKTRLYKLNGKKTITIDEIFDIETFKILRDKRIFIWGWYGLSKFEGVIPPNNIERGLRLRKDNIQIGSENTLAKLHKQEKNNRYFIGEVHVFDQELIPNARRDYFIENKHCRTFEEELSQFFDKDLKPLFNTASKMRAAGRKLENFSSKREEIKELKKIGITNENDIETLSEELEKKKQQAETAKKTLQNIKNKINNNETQKKLYNRIIDQKEINIPRTVEKIKNDIQALPHRTERYSKLSRKERKLISKVFEIIDSALPKEVAQNIKQLIDEKFE